MKPDSFSGWRSVALPLDANMLRKLRRRRHPRLTGRIAALLARWPLLSLLLAYLLVLVILGGALGAAQLVASEAPLSLDGWWAFSTVSFAQLVHSSAAFEPPALLDQGVTTVAAVLAALLPPLFFGAVVFKVLHAQSRLTFRDRIALVSRPRGDFLLVRFYNSSRLLLVDLTLTAVVRIWHREDGTDVLRNHVLEVENPRWPYALTHMPFTLRIPLESGDTRRRSPWFPARSRLRLVAVQGHRLRSEDDCLAIIVRGDLPQIGRSFVEKHDYGLPSQVDARDYTHIHPQMKDSSRHWRGWDGFDAG